MVDVYIPEQKEDENLRNQYFDYAKTGTLDVLGSTLDETLYYNPANALGRLAEQKLGSGREGRMLTKDEWAESDYFREGIEVGDEGIKEGLATLLADRYDERADFKTTLSRSRGGLGLGAAQFGVAIAGSFLDPLNVGSAFIPSIATARMATAASRIGKRGNRFTTGMMDGAIGAAVIEPVVIGAAVAEQDRDYGLMDSFLNVAVGSALGGGLHWGAGKISDRINKLPSSTRDEAQKISLKQAAADEDIDVTSITDNVEKTNIAKMEDQAGKKIVYDSEGIPRAVDVIDIDKDGTITIRDADGTEKVLDTSDTFSKSPYDEDYEITMLDGEDAVSNLPTESLDDIANILENSIKAAEEAGDATLVAKIKKDKKAIEIERRRRGGEVVIRPADPDIGQAAEAQIAKLKADIEKIQSNVAARQKKEGLEKPKYTAKQISQIQSKQEKIATLESQQREAAGLVQTEQGVLTPQQKENAANSASIEGDGLGRLGEYKEAVQEIEADRPEIDEIDPAEIQAENDLLEEDLNTAENQAILPSDIKQSIAATEELDAKADAYEGLSRAGANCLIGTKKA
jgi:hypothetical protein